MPGIILKLKKKPMFKKKETKYYEYYVVNVFKILVFLILIK